MRQKLSFLLFIVPLTLSAQQPWQQITVPTTREVAANFLAPPREYGAIHWAIWGGPLTQERITSEFDALTKEGMYVVNFGPARGMTPKYLSPEHLALTKFAVEEAKKRGMKVWLADEGSYPSGFAGGKISEEYPQLTMQGMVADVRVSIAPGQTIAMPVPVDTLAAMAVNMPAPSRMAPLATGLAMGVSPTPGGSVGPPAGTAETLPIVDGQIKWTAPPDGRWEIGVSSQGHINQPVQVRPRLTDSSLVAWEASWNESETMRPSDNMLRKEYAQLTRLQRAVNVDVASLHANPEAETVDNVRKQQEPIETSPIRRLSPAGYQRRHGEKENVTTGEALGARRRNLVEEATAITASGKCRRRCQGGGSGHTTVDGRAAKRVRREGPGPVNIPFDKVRQG